jgi:uncharacterized protein DUF3618
MAAERSADDIQRDIEHARVALAGAVDALVYRTSPKRVTANAKQAVLAKAQTPQGQAVIAGVGVLVLVLITRRVRRR